MNKTNKRKSGGHNNSSQIKRKRKSDANSSTDSDTQDDSMSSPGSNKSSFQQTHSRSGQILSVKLKNFMCHQNLSVDFGRRANLLIGQNGSGKSAVLTALIIGLGSRANATMRSHSIKQFIRTGQQSATIEIRISNDGSDAYEKHLYGNRITVCRTITASGASSYKMKNPSGNVISTSRAELVKMIMYMNIQVDNPVCVMTQDASRSFLRDSDPKRHYELFMKATQLDVVIGILDECVKQINSTKSKMQVQKSICDKHKEAERIANEKLQRIQSLEPLKEEIKRFKIEQNWLAVVNQEEFIEREINSMLTQTQNQRGLLEAKLTEITENENQNSLDELAIEIDDLKKHLTKNEIKMNAEKANYQRETVEMQSFARQVKTTEAKIKNIQSIIQKLEESIEEELNSNKGEVEDLKATNEAKLTELKSKVQDLEAVIKSHKGEHSVFTGANDKYKSQNDEIRNKKAKLQEDKRHVHRQLANIHAAPKEALRQIAEYMPDLIDTIDKLYKANKFQRKPIGPIANYIEVVHPKYRQYVEDTIGGLMMAFCVDNGNDSKILRQLLQTRFPQAKNIPIICSHFQDNQYNVSQKCVRRIGEAIPLLELIEVNDPNVKNCLIDQQNIETILFTENINEAQQLTSKSANVPPNLSRIILLSPYSEFYPAPNYRQYAKRSKNARILRLKTDNKEQYLRTELASIDETIQSLRKEESDLAPVVAENLKRLEALSKSIRDSEQEHYVLTRQVGDLEAFEYPQQPEVSVMQAEVDEQNKILESVKAKYIEEMETLNEKEHSVKVIEDKIQEIKTNVRKYEQELLEKQKAKDKIEDKLGKRDALIKHYKSKITNANQAIDRLLKELTSAKNKLDRLEAAANKVGPRIEPTHDEEQLAALIKRNEQKINTTHKSKETIEVVTAQLEEARSELMKSQTVIETLERSVHLMRTALQSRFTNLKRLKIYMVRRITHIFMNIMKLRSINGTLKFNDEKRTLEIEAVPHAQKNDATVSKTTNLSGGERSYVTVAFLIALWSCVDHPFYFLDEYDVFTDDVNRTYMTKLLLNESKKQKWYQYTFLTPQEASGTENFKDLKVLRLANPER